MSESTKSFNKAIEEKSSLHSKEKQNRAVNLEETRLDEINDVSDYHMIHERHRIFPVVFENRNHKSILDISAGVGIVADRIKSKYPAELLCNDLSPKALSILQRNGHKTASFDLDQAGKTYPLESEQFDAVISLATIEHILDIDHFLSEINRILKEDSYLYISAPNYSGLTYLLPFLFSGKTFHDPLKREDKYEFYAHVKYFTYRTLIEVVSQFGFETEAVYIGKPCEASGYLNLKRKSPLRAKMFKLGMSTIYKLFSPRWAAEPVICFKKTKMAKINLKPKKIIM
jgi:2-polyprenyl-3-methyl-5-hydroxy-6-metoxy-1,4-benzoquinol methylase